MSSKRYAVDFNPALSCQPLGRYAVNTNDRCHAAGFLDSHDRGCEASVTKDKATERNKRGLCSQCTRPLRCESLDRSAGIAIMVCRSCNERVEAPRNSRLFKLAALAEELARLEKRSA